MNKYTSGKAKTHTAWWHRRY